MTTIKVIKKDFLRNKYIYLMLMPVLVWFVLFVYKPMYGAVIAFQDFNPIDGILHSPWVGFDKFREFFSSYYIWRIIRNTIILSLYSLLFVFPAPIIFALLINELRSVVFKRMVQSITYLPYFISLVVICGLIKDFTVDTGVINDIVAFLGGKKVTMLQEPGLFRSIYIISEIWQNIGWGTIIYLAALANIDTQQYEAAIIDGAKRWKQLWYITIPGVMPTVTIMFILQIGFIFSASTEKILLLYNPVIYETSDVIFTFVFRKGLVEMDYSYSAAVGIFQSVVNLILLLSANQFSKKFNGTTLW